MSGHLLAVIVHAANIHDTVAGILPAQQAVKVYPSIKKFCGDMGYRGTFVLDVEKLLHLGVDISEKIKPLSLICDNVTYKCSGKMSPAG